MWHRLAYDDLHCTVEEARVRVGRAAFLDWLCYREIVHEEQKKAIDKAKQQK